MLSTVPRVSFRRLRVDVSLDNLVQPALAKVAVSAPETESAGVGVRVAAATSLARSKCNTPKCDGLKPIDAIATKRT